MSSIWYAYIVMSRDTLKMTKTDIMKPVSLPKKTVAKLLATENIDVVSEKIPTAYFDLKSRKIAVPVWEDVSQNVYDLLIGHEVGHALYTPLKLIKESRKREIPKSFINVVEDIRIEKMIQEKYPGLIRNFKTGYEELTKRDFFGIKKYSPDLKELGLVDRLNIYAKTKNNDIGFLDKEQWIFTEVGKMKTWKDAVDVAEKLAKYMEDNPESQGESIKIEDFEYDEDATEYVEVEVSESDDSSDSSDGKDGKEKELDKSEKESDKSNSDFMKGTEGGDDWVSSKYTSESITDKNLQKKLQSNADTTGEYINVEMPDYDLKDVILTADEIAKLDKKEIKIHDYDNKSQIMHNYLEKDFKKFKNTSMTNVNYLVKEFEMKKSADNYSRATVSKQGSLNLKLLHKYKFEDDLFLKVTNIPDGKSHGLIFYLDWSGSMDRNLIPTMQQLFNLVWFAKKTNIPFEVYAFTNAYGRRSVELKDVPIFDRKTGNMKLAYGDSFTLLEICNSKMNNAKLNEALKLFYGFGKRMTPWNIKDSEERNAYYGTSVPRPLQLGGTPLLETAYVNIEVCDRFLKTYGVDKLNVCYLTDGCGSSFGQYWGEPDGKKMENGRMVDVLKRLPIPTHHEHVPFFGEMPDEDSVKIREEKMEKYEKSNTHVKVGKHHSFDIPPVLGQWENAKRGDSISTNLFGYEFEQLSKIAKQKTNCNIIGFHLLEATKTGKVRNHELMSVLCRNEGWALKSYNKETGKNHIGANQMVVLPRAIRTDVTSEVVTYAMNKIAKEGVYNVHSMFGFDDYFLLPGSKNLELEDVELSDELVGANKRKLITAFGKNRNSKVKKRVLCNKFIDRIS